MGINERGDERCQFNIQITGTRKQILSLFSSDELSKEIKQTLVCDEILKKNLDERDGMIQSCNFSVQDRPIHGLLAQLVEPNCFW